MGKLPVLLIGFTKKDQLLAVMAALEAYGPSRIYIAQDGPRPDRPTDGARIAEVRRVLEDVRWPCLRRYRFQDTNLGVQVHIEQAVSWFFEHEEAGIILEDDTLPTPDFFRYCEALIERYREDKRVWMIGGCNLNMVSKPSPSYFFTSEAICWGWATWRDRWQQYDPTMSAIDAMATDGSLSLIWPDPFRREHELQRIQEMRNGVFKAWDYRWGYTIMANHGLTILPSRNLVVNLGFGEGATNTHDPLHPAGLLRAESMEWPLVHPPYVTKSWEWEQNFFYRGQHLHRYLSMKELLVGIWRRFVHKALPGSRQQIEPPAPPKALKPSSVLKNAASHPMVAVLPQLKLV